MKLLDRLQASLDFAHGKIKEIDEDIDRYEAKLVNLREARLREEEEALETQLLFNLARDSGLKVERREEDGMLVASVNEKYGAAGKAIQ